MTECYAAYVYAIVMGNLYCVVLDKVCVLKNASLVLLS